MQPKLFLVLLAATLLPLPALAQDGCWVCAGANDRSQTIFCADADFHFQLGRDTCTTVCHIVDPFEICFCRTQGADCGYQDIPDQDFLVGGADDVRALDHQTVHAHSHVPSEVVRQAAADADEPLLRILLATTLSPGQADGLLSLKDKTTGEFNVYPVNLEVKWGDGTTTFRATIENHPTLNTVAGELTLAGALKLELGAADGLVFRSYP